MLIVTIAVLVILIMIFDATMHDIAQGACVLLLIVVGIALIANITILVNGRVIDEKIAMYEEENTRIEQAVSEAVSQYMEYESETFKDLKGESVIQFVSLYPELSADVMVETQIEVYLANNETIRELKEQKISIETARWWVYFG